MLGIIQEYPMSRWFMSLFRIFKSHLDNWKSLRTFKVRTENPEENPKEDISELNLANLPGKQTFALKFLG